MIVLLLVEHPGLERFAVGHRKAGEKVCAQRLGQKLQAPPWSSGQRARKRLQLRDVKRVVAGGIELHVGQCDEEKRRGPADPPVVGRRDVAVPATHRRSVTRNLQAPAARGPAPGGGSRVRSCRGARARGGWRGFPGGADDRPPQSGKRRARGPCPSRNRRRLPRQLRHGSPPADARQALSWEGRSDAMPSARATSTLYQMPQPLPRGTPEINCLWSHRRNGVVTAV